VPLDHGGGCLTIGYGSGGSPLFIPSSDSEGLAFLKISLFSRPLNPFCDAQSFRLARRLPDNFKGPWATITKRVIHHPSHAQSPRPDFQRPVTEFAIDTTRQFRIVVSDKINAKLSNCCLINQKPLTCMLLSLVPNDQQEKSASPLDLSKWSASWLSKTLRQHLFKGNTYRKEDFGKCIQFESAVQLTSQNVQTWPLDWLSLVNQFIIASILEEIPSTFPKEYFICRKRFISLPRFWRSVL
jgi:hypothetical protein